MTDTFRYKSTSIQSLLLTSQMSNWSFDHLNDAVNRSTIHLIQESSLNANVFVFFSEPYQCYNPKLFVTLFDQIKIFNEKRLIHIFKFKPIINIKKKYLLHCKRFDLLEKMTTILVCSNILRWLKHYTEQNNHNWNYSFDEKYSKIFELFRNYVEWKNHGGKQRRLLRRIGS